MLLLHCPLAARRKSLLSWSCLLQWKPLPLWWFLILLLPLMLQLPMLLLPTQPSPPPTLLTALLLPAAMLTRLLQTLLLLPLLPLLPLLQSLQSNLQGRPHGLSWPGSCSSAPMQKAPCHSDRGFLHWFDRSMAPTAFQALMLLFTLCQSVPCTGSAMPMRSGAQPNASASNGRTRSGRLF